MAGSRVCHPTPAGSSPVVSISKGRSRKGAALTSSGVWQTQPVDTDSSQGISHQSRFGLFNLSADQSRQLRRIIDDSEFSNRIFENKQLQPDNRGAVPARYVNRRPTIVDESPDRSRWNEAKLLIVISWSKSEIETSLRLRDADPAWQADGGHCNRGCAGCGG